MTTTTANPGAETPFPSVPGDAARMEDEHGASQYAEYERAADGPAAHDPDAKALLRRYLSEVHSYREMGNHALRSLEARLATLPPHPMQSRTGGHDRGQPGEDRGGYGSRMITPSLPAGGEARPARNEPGLGQRLRELSAYLHADLSREPPEDREPPRSPPPRPAAPPRDYTAHKIPTLPVLDRSWFEERFSALRGSMDQLAEQVPLKRLERLEAQFRDLMERLTARETSRDPRPMEASLKKLATYLADSRQWAVANEKRVKGVEDKLDRLSKLVAQSHAAISATAKGLELVAQGTGEKMARRTADIVAARMGDKIGEKLVERLDRLNPADRLDQLGREVAHLSAQSRHIARNTDERLEQIQIGLREGNKVFPRPPAATAESAAAQTAPKAAAADGSPHEELQSYLNQPLDPDDDYDSDMIAAAQRAASLADGSDQNASPRNAPVRYQIPYGEFLPDEDSPASRAGLIIAMVILLLAGATMLFLKMKEWTLVEPAPAVSLSEPYRQSSSAESKQAKLTVPQASDAAPAPRDNSAALADAGTAGVPVVTGSTPAAPMPSNKPLQLWVASSKPAEQETAETKPRETPAMAGWETSFREAAVKGDLNAQFSVGQSYLSGEDGEAHLSGSDRLSRAARWFRRAAEGGHAPSQYRIATLYELGHGTPRNVIEAEKWYERAAAQGHVKAMHNLAVLAIAPGGRTANYLTAARWFKEAAAHGLVDSQFNLGVLHERGFGMVKDPVEAYRWFALAARQKDQKAQQKRDEVARMLTASERVKAERLVAEWRAKPRIEAVNRLAPEPPAAINGGEKTPNAPRTADMPTAAIMRTSWKTDVAPVRKPSGNAAMVAEAQRILKQRGYDPGPIDGVPGKRTQDAVRSFQRRLGMAPTGDVTEVLIAKMAFLPL
jgi:TPR repeat protein